MADRADALAQELRTFSAFGRETVAGVTAPLDPPASGGARVNAPGAAVASTHGGAPAVETFTNEFWTSKQRAARRLHEISYRACFKPQLPRFFIERLTEPGDVVYDPFMGRGTTLLEAALLGRVPYGCDVNPLGEILVGPRLSPPATDAVEARLGEIDFARRGRLPEELLVFYHPDTLREVVSLRRYLLERQQRAELDRVDEWIRMVAVSRLTGHSSGFFSVYTLPPNQAVTVESQRRINARRGQTPPRRSVPELILRK
ncbi:MAG: site-specific DNA-methyltransferase, partial [Candidatus Eisenbacteria bacterium]|nr:site-specific DNA-methyltransferase [Candidatus Eisenbacteria bacterium]